MPRESFEVVPPTSGTTALALVLPLGAAAAIAVAGARHEPAVLAWLLPLLVLLGAVAWLTLVRRSVTIVDGLLHVRAGVHSNTMPLAAIDAGAARVVDLDERTDLRPLMKTFGTSLPGLSMGHFLLRDRGRAFVLLTARRKVLLLPASDGRRLLLSLEHPQRLLEALSDAAAAR